MRGAATTNKVPDPASIKHAAVFSRSWALCCVAVRAGVQQALAIQRHHGIVPPGAWVPQPNSLMVMLVESDVSMPSHGIVS